VVKGDSIEEVLNFVQYSAEDLVNRLRRTAETAVKAGHISFEEAGHFLDKYERGLEGYTYLESKNEE